MSRLAVSLALFAATTAAATTPALAAELIYQPTAPAYTVVQVDSRKLKTTLAAALQAWPGNECTATTDLNGAISCPGVSLPGTLTYNTNIFGFQAPTVTTVDNNGRVRTDQAKVDGLKWKLWMNTNAVSGVPLSVLCPDGLTAIQTPPPPARPIVVTPTRPMTEFGIEFSAHESAALTDIDVEVNGVIVGNFIPVQNQVNYVGVSAPEGITSLRFLPHDVLRGQTYGCNNSLTYEYGYVFGDRFFYQ